MTAYPFRPRIVHFALIEGEDETACSDHDPSWLSADAADVTCPECKDWLA